MGPPPPPPKMVPPRWEARPIPKNRPGWEPAPPGKGAGGPIHPRNANSRRNSRAFQKTPFARLPAGKDARGPRFSPCPRPSPTGAGNAKKGRSNGFRARSSKVPHEPAALPPPRGPRRRPPQTPRALRGFGKFRHLAPSPLGGARAPGFKQPPPDEGRQPGFGDPTEDESKAPLPWQKARGAPKIPSPLPPTRGGFLKPPRRDNSTGCRTGNFMLRTGGWEQHLDSPGAPNHGAPGSRIPGPRAPEGGPGRGPPPSPFGERAGGDEYFPIKRGAGAAEVAQRGAEAPFFLLHPKGLAPRGSDPFWPTAPQQCRLGPGFRYASAHSRRPHRRHSPLSPLAR